MNFNQKKIEFYVTQKIRLKIYLKKHLIRNFLNSISYSRGIDQSRRSLVQIDLINEFVLIVGNLTNIRENLIFMEDKNNIEYGDERFKKFINNLGDQKRENNPEEPFELILNALKYKINAISEFYTNTLTAYLRIREDDPLKEDFRKYLNLLIDSSMQAIDQFNYMLIDLDNTEEDDSINGKNNANGDKKK